MKKKLIGLAALLIASGAYAQVEVTVGVTRGKDYGVTYLLPKTEIEIVLQTTKHTYTPGQLCKYADRYLRLDDVSGEASEYWTLDKIETRVVGVPDKNNVYFVKMKDKSVAPLMELTEDGIVRSINMPFSGEKKGQKEAAAAVLKPEEKRPDPRSFLTEEILQTGSTGKMAELIAKEIYAIRESKNALLRGEADNMPQDGAQLKLMLDNLTTQEELMTEMFSGQVKEEQQSSVIRLVPKEMKDKVAFRFSRKLGIVSVNDLAGDPYYITIVNLKTPDTEGVEEPKKKLEGIAYNVPGRAKVILTGMDNRKIFDAELPISQFGTTEFLESALFNKNSTVKILFNTATGGIVKVDRE